MGADDYAAEPGIDQVQHAADAVNKEITLFP
jgi:hypothetical protein